MKKSARFLQLNAPLLIKFPTMLTALIIDDESHARVMLRHKLKQFANVLTVLGEASDIKSGVRLIQKHQPDVVFLDIEMPEYNGFELFEFFDNLNFEVIFVTAYSEYAVKAFDISALDYLLKPIDDERLQAAVDKVVQKKSEKSYENRLQLMQEYLESNQLKKIAVPYSEGYLNIEVDDIIMIQADRAYCQLFYEGNCLLVSKSLNKLQETLADDSRFVRIHRSFLINKQKIVTFKSSNNEVLLENNLIAKVSRNQLSSFKSLFKTT